MVIKKSFNQFISEEVSDKLKAALDNTSPKEIDNNNDVEENSDNGVVTTEEEIEAFHTVKSIARKAVDANRIVMRDTKSYCGVLLDDNNRKPIIRLRFNSSQKYIGLFDADKNEEKIAIDNIDQIFEHSDKILAAVKSYD
jgi:hypothetical protein